MVSAATQSRPDDALVVRLGGGEDAAAIARSGLSKLEGAVDRPLVDALRLLVTELVGNSVRHGNADSIELRVEVGRDRVRTAVTDDGRGFDPAAVDGPREDQTGWGLVMVDRLAERWGVDRDAGSTRVWFDLPRGALGAPPTG